MNTLKNIALVVALGAATFAGGCNYRNVDKIKAAAPATWAAAGFEVIGYAGYQIGDLLGSPGGKVWYIVQRKGDTKTRYHGYVSKWGSEYHVYSLRALDALTHSDS